MKLASHMHSHNPEVAMVLCNYCTLGFPYFVFISGHGKQFFPHVLPFSHEIYATYSLTKSCYKDVAMVLCMTQSGGTITKCAMERLHT